jgi:hypothetical protein
MQSNAFHIRHIVTGQGACDVRDVMVVVARCGPGFYIIKLPALIIKIQVISMTHLIQIMHNENKKASTYRRYTLV